MFGKLKGKKTYVVAALSALGALASYLTGELELAQAAQLCLTAVLGATVRNAIN
jgi:hypothetical protein